MPLLLLGQGRDAFYLLAIVLTVCPAIALTLIDGEGLAAEAHA